MINILSVVLFIIASFTEGYALILACDFNDIGYRYSFFLSAPVGLAVNAIFAGFTYLRLGRPAYCIRYVYATLFCFSIVYIILRLKKSGLKCNDYYFGLAMVLILFFIVAVPGTAKGERYYLHKGNVYDKFSYLSEVDYVINYDTSYGEELMDEREFPSRIYLYGYDMIENDRPVAALICGSLSEGGSLFLLGHLYTSMVWSFIFGPVMFLLEFCFPGRKKWGYAVFSLIYLFSYYCQLQNDIDAWSQVVGASVLISFAAMWLVLMKKIRQGDSISIRNVVLFCVTGTGAFVVYPEGMWVYGLVLTVMSIIMFTRYKLWSKQTIITVMKAAVIPVILLGGTYAVHTGTFVYAIKQIKGGNSDTIQKWSSFYNYWKGAHELVTSSRLGEMVKRAATIIPGWCGMSILTPVYTGIPMIVILFWLLLMAGLSLGIVILSVYCIHLAIVRAEKTFEAGMVLSVSAVSVVLFLLYIVMGKWLTASKILLFLSPFIYVLLAFPVMERFSGFGRLIDNSGIRRLFYMVSFAVSAVFVISQIACPMIRLFKMISNPDGVMTLGYYYPQMESKVKADWPEDFSVKELKGESVAALSGGDTFSKEYIALALAYEGTDYYYLDPFAEDPDKYTRTETGDSDPVIYYHPGKIWIER